MTVLRPTHTLSRGCSSEPSGYAHNWGAPFSSAVGGWKPRSCRPPCAKFCSLKSHSKPWNHMKSHDFVAQITHFLMVFQSRCAARSHLIVAGSESGSLLVPGWNGYPRENPKNMRKSHVFYGFPLGKGSTLRLCQSLLLKPWPIEILDLFDLPIFTQSKSGDFTIARCLMTSYSTWNLLLTGGFSTSWWVYETRSDTSHVLTVEIAAK